MIPLIEKTIREKLPELASGELSFLKYSTPSSGRKPEDKVIFLVFRNEETEPFLCAKTVRSYAGKNAIAKSFNNLKKLNELSMGTGHESLFAKALYLHDDGENIFSLESACRGERKRLNLRELERVVGLYSSFQEALAQKEKEVFDAGEYAEKLVRGANLDERDKEALTRRFVELKGLLLPRVLQHGDVTEDNMLISTESVSLVDCDYVGLSDVPGFDLFCLFFRHDKREARKLFQEYMPKYFSSIGVEVSSDKFDTLALLYYFMEKALRKPEAFGALAEGQLVADFDRFFAQDKPAS